MNDEKKTGIFAVVTMIALGLAFMARPTAIRTESELASSKVGTPLFETFEDPSKAASFQIIKYDEELAQLKPFEVAKDRQTNLWKLPSNDDYPADAAEQVRDATTPLVALNVLSLVTSDRGDHSLYGVVNPDDENLSVAETGVGMMLRVRDEKNEVLAALIVGKEVEGAPGQRYVRNPSEDAVYVVELDTTPFSTDFAKWIKGELLGVRAFDISEISLKDYLVVPTNRGYGMQRNYAADVTFNSDSRSWELEKLVTYESGEEQSKPLAEGQALNKQALDELRTAIQELKIVDVRRKPTGLAADLQADKSLLENKDSLESLYEQGFFPQEGPNGPEIYATGGETLIRTTDGIQYTLRFGETTAKMSDTKDDSEEGGLRRYLLVTARFDDAQVPFPELQPVPETVEEMLKLEMDSKDPAENAEKSPTEQGSDEVLAVTDGSEAKPESTPSAGNSSESAATSNGAATESTSTEVPASDAPTGETSGSASETTGDSQPNEAADGRSSEVPATPAANEGSALPDRISKNVRLVSTSAEPQENQPAADTVVESTPENASNESPTVSEVKPEGSNEAESPKANAADETAEELQERLEALKEKIAKDNQRKIDARNEELQTGRKKAAELNARFSDWYYVVNESSYKKLKLSLNELIQDSAKDSAEAERPSPPQLPELDAVETDAQ